MELSSSSPLDEEEEHRLLFNSRGWDLLDSRSDEPFQRRDSDSEHRNKNGIEKCAIAAKGSTQGVKYVALT